jgi:hypothetical protein
MYASKLISDGSSVGIPSLINFTFVSGKFVKASTLSFITE